MLRVIYKSYILKYPKAVILILIGMTLFLGYEATKLEVDASAETLVLEDDKDLKLSRLIDKRYSGSDFLVITFTPKEELLSDRTLNTLKRLKKDLLALKGVKSVVSLLDVPLLESPPMPIKELLKDVPSLETPSIDKKLAKIEFINSPIYRELLVSADFKTTALQVNLHEDEAYRGMINRRYELRQLEKEEKIADSERTELDKIQVDLKTLRDKMRIIQHENILEVRTVMDQYREEGELFLGGVSMIADDLVTFIKNDLSIFGIGVLIFLIITLWVIFRQIRWVVLPIICCGFSVVATCGILGMFGWEVTVISSNFISLQIIITMALTIHLTVRYRELIGINPDWPQEELVLEAALFMAKPCFFAIVTTMAGFCSLILSGILPVIDFGWMMTAGIGVSLILTFLLFPTILILLEKIPPNITFESHFTFTSKLADLTAKFGNPILIISGVILILSIVGASRLMVENSFIDYFKESTEIYQGMEIIDQQLGGTTPLEVVLNFPEGDQESPVPENGSGDGNDEFDDFEEEFEAEKNQAQYWFTSDKMRQVEKLHDYLDSLPETGKVLSLGTMLKIGEKLNDGEPLDNFKLALIYNELPEDYRKIILDPYVSIEHNQARVSIRIRDSDPNLRRNELLKKIRSDLTDKLNFTDKEVQVTGIMVLYNNMLQSLFNSQILTLGAVIAALLLMFLLLFRDIRIAFIAIFPNILSVGVVLGFMGWAKIPLDLMTITIAAISVGIAVDDTIHYIHRFKEEFVIDKNYIASMHRCHESIGYAMYYTSITIIIGFSILVLSNFIPSIYFGLLTGLAMVIALIAALTLLPQLIIFIKPFGPEVPVQT
ncbi:MAG: MMPL family transporter [Deltaproteobacteria bacterium]|nr:MMPL family transporter [Deltaproteobacteria bacterium]